jgi:hypothetical protein
MFQSRAIHKGSTFGWLTSAAKLYFGALRCIVVGDQKGVETEWCRASAKSTGLWFSRVKKNSYPLL